MECPVHPDQPLVGTCRRCGDFGCRLCIPEGRATCSKCAPEFGSGIAKKPDVGDAINFVTKDPNAFSRVLGGSLCLLLSMFLVPMFVLIGYRSRIARGIREGTLTALPPWDDLGGLAGDGFRCWLAILFPGMLFMFTIGLVVAGVVVGIALLGAGGPRGGPNPTVAVVAGLGMFGLVAAVIALSLGIAYATPAITIHHFRTGSVFAGLQFREVWKIVSGRPGDYAMLFLYGFVLSFLANLVGQLLCYVGIFLTMPAYFYADGHLLGRYWAWLDFEESRKELGP